MIAVSIVSYNTSSLLKKLLENLSAQKEVKTEIWVLDNNSEDDSVEMIKKNFPKVHLSESKENTGFAKGQNILLKKIESPLILILNPDTRLENDSLSKMLHFMQSNPEVGIASSKVLDSKGNLTSNGGNFPYGISLLSWLFNFDKPGIPSFHRNDQDFYNLSEAKISSSASNQMIWVSGAFMMVRKEVLEKVNYFNEDYFMYFEDVELCYKALKSGYRVAINPNTQTTHLSGASSKNPRLNQWKGEMRGLIKFSYKNFGTLYGIYVGLLVRLAIVLRIISFAVLGKLDYSGTYTKVLFSL